jgi:hypothetical protein
MRKRDFSALASSLINNSEPGLPDGIYFQTKKPYLGKFLEGLAMEDTWLIHFCEHLAYFVSVWYVLWSFGNFFSFW